MLCKTCNENILQSDVIGDRCVYCYGYEIVKRDFNDFSCIKCKEVKKSLINEMCKKCYNEYMEY